MSQDKNTLPRVYPAERVSGGFVCRFSWWDQDGKRRRGRGYGLTPKEAAFDATSRWWLEVRRVRDILHGRAAAPEEPKLTLVALVNESVKTLQMAQRPKQVRTSLHYMAKYWAGWCLSCSYLNDEACARLDAGIELRAKACKRCGGKLLGTVTIDQIRPAHCNGVLAAVSGRAKAPKPATVNRIRGAAAVIFRFAVSNELLDEAPTDRAHRRLEPKTLPRVMSGPDALAMVGKLDVEWRLFILLMLCAGLRLGEARQLRAADVELDRSRIIVRRGGADGTPKGDKERVVPIVSSRLRLALQAAVRRPGTTTVVGGRIDPRGAISRACEAADVAAPTRHGLRHWFCSAALAMRVPLPVVKGWMGHSEISVTDRYAHALAPSDAIAALLDELGPHAR